MNNETHKTDYINIAYGLISIGVIASYGWPMFFILAPLFYGQKALRNTPAAKQWSQKVITAAKLPLALPAPKDAKPIAMPVKAPSVRVVDPYSHLGFWDRITKPYDDNTAINTGSALIELGRDGKVKQTAETRQYGYLQWALKRLPGYFHYTQLPNAIPSRLSVPIGLDAQSGDVLWGDFDADSDKARILHAMIAGQTGSGKDALLRLWFTTLTLNNTPEEIQFVILDGKIDWLSNALASSVYMAVPPAGGMEIKKIDGKRIDLAKARMAESMDWVFDEIDRRAELMRRAGVVNLNAYNAKAAKLGEKPLPMIFLIASDVGKTFDGDLGMLVNQLIMKGRAYGIRMIISMQNPIGEDTGWRAQIGLVMSGYQQNPDQDRFIMGVNKDRALIRPSQLPNPQEEDIAIGLFVVRQGSKQYLVRTPHLPEDDWFTYIESDRFLKKWYSKQEQDQLLNEILFNEVPTPKLTRRLESIAPVIDNPKNILTHDQIKETVKWARAGHTKSEIMTMLGFTNGDVWNAKKSAVEAVIISARGTIRR